MDGWRKSNFDTRWLHSPGHPLGSPGGKLLIGEPCMTSPGQQVWNSPGRTWPHALGGGFKPLRWSLKELRAGGCLLTPRPMFGQQSLPWEGNPHLEYHTYNYSTTIKIRTVRERWRSGILSAVYIQISPIVPFISFTAFFPSSISNLGMESALNCHSFIFPLKSANVSQFFFVFHDIENFFMKIVSLFCRLSLNLGLIDVP